MLLHSLFRAFFLRVRLVLIELKKFGQNSAEHVLSISLDSSHFKPNLPFSIRLILLTESNGLLQCKQQQQWKKTLHISTLSLFLNHLKYEAAMEQVG